MTYLLSTNNIYIIYISPYLEGMYTHTISLKSTCTHSYILKVRRYNFAIYIFLKISIREQSKRINNEESIKKRCRKKRKDDEKTN